MSRNNSFYRKKLKESKRIFQDKSDVVSTYSNFCREFYLALFRRLTPFVKVDNILRVRKIIWNKLFYATLPFRVWNHLFLCCRSQYESNMCLFCTRIYLKNKRLTASIEKKSNRRSVRFFSSASFLWNYKQRTRPPVCSLFYCGQTETAEL